MAGSAATLTYDETGPIKKILLDWTSDDTTGAVTATTKKISGYLLKGITNPGATAPTADYDIVITDATHSANVLANTTDDLVDRHTSNTEVVDFFMTGSGARPCVCDVLSIAITAAGNSKVGQLALYWAPG